MKRDLDLPLLTIDGKPYEDKATLKTVLFSAITVPVDSDQTMSTDDKMKLYGLAQRVYAGGIADFKAEEIALMKARIGKLYPVLVVGAAFALLEQEEKKE